MFLTRKIFQKMEKDHNTGGKCCFCDRRHQQTNPGYLPTIIFWVALAKLVSKILMAYILFEALYKVHNFPSMTNSLKQTIFHFHSVWNPKKKIKKMSMVEMLIFCTIMIYLNDLRFKKQNFPKICRDILWIIKGHPLKCKKT